MQLNNLEKLYDDCRHLPHYQFKEMSEFEFLEKAGKSINKLTPDQQKKVYDSWAKQIGKTDKSQLTQDEIFTVSRYRFLAQTNLYFLCHLLERYNNITLNTHEDICNDFFPQK